MNLAGRYTFIFADPPWGMQEFGSKKHGRADEHYPCMTPEQLRAIPVGDMAAKDGALLMMWCTGPKGSEGSHVELARAWGFEPVTRIFVWLKCEDKCAGCGASWHQHAERLTERGPRRWLRGGYEARGCLAFTPSPAFGLGRFTRGSVEDCWLFRSKKAKTRFSSLRAAKNIPQTIIAPLELHSMKPVEAQARVAVMWPDMGRGVELFARARIPGWDAFGLDLGHAIGPWGVEDIPASVVSAGHRARCDWVKARLARAS